MKKMNCKSKLEKSKKTKERASHSKPLLSLSVCGLLSLSLLAGGLSSCKAWRTITTTATYVQQNDSTQSKTTTSISTKTVEEYQGVKKR